MSSAPSGIDPARTSEAPGLAEDMPAPKRSFDVASFARAGASAVGTIASRAASC